MLLSSPMLPFKDMRHAALNVCTSAVWLFAVGFMTLCQLCAELTCLTTTDYESRWPGTSKQENNGLLLNTIIEKLLNLRWMNMVAPWLHCWCGFLRRQELRELRLLQKEEQRAQQQLSNKLQQQREQIYRRFEQETAVSQFVRTAVVWCFCIWLTPRKRAASSQSWSESDGGTHMKDVARHKSVFIIYSFSFSSVKTQILFNQWCSQY